MTLPDDFREFLHSLNARDVEFFVVGGHAVSFHGYPRFTHDVDVVVLPRRGNAARLLLALADFGFGTLELSEDDVEHEALDTQRSSARQVFKRPDIGAIVHLGVVHDFTRDTTVALGRAPHQIDIMTYVKGVDIEDAWRRSAPGTLDGVPVRFIGKADLIANKLAVGRPEDLADVARLER